MMPETSALLTLVLVAAAAYLVGSVPTGVIVARIYRNTDLTQVGSQRTGATNVARSLGLGAGAIVLLGDLGKGALAVLAAGWLSPEPIALGLAWFASIMGHMRSVFLGGRGGRGVGTGLGGLAAIAFPLFLASTLSGTIAVAATRYVSLGSLIGSVVALVTGVVACVIGQLPIAMLPFVVACPIAVIWAHGDNIERLRAGRERRFGDRAAEPG